MICLSVPVLLVVLLLLPPTSGRLQVRWSPAGDYKVLVDGQVWLTSAPTALHCNGQHHSTADRTLKLISPPDVGQKAYDKLGFSNVTLVKYGMRNVEQQLVASVREYEDQDAAVFAQVSRDVL